MTIAKRTGKKQLINLLLQYGAKSVEDLKSGKAKKGASVVMEVVKDLPPSLTKKNSNSETIKTETLPTEKKQAKRFVLTHLKDGEWQPLSAEDLDLFEQHYPDIARYWTDQTAVESLQVPKFPDNTPIYESWDKVARRLLSHLKKSTHARYFQDPVDPKRDKLNNYYSIISKPMDLSTVKQRLNTNYYYRMQEFLDDVSLIFENCVTYHGGEDLNTSVVKACRQLREDFKRLYEQLNIEFYLV